MKDKIIWWISTALCIMSAALTIIARTIEGFGQRYSVTIYPGFVETIGRLWGGFSYSIVEIGLYIVVCLILGCMLRCLLKKENRKKEAKRFASRIVLFASILLLVYVINCGINYHRTSFAEGAGLSLEEYNVEQLTAVCEFLTKEINTLAPKVMRNSEGQMVLDGNEQEEAVKALNALSNVYPDLQGYYPIPKKLVNPWILSIQQLSGIYSPFTIEANYNNAMVEYNIPFTICHELSHLRGFMQEQEANFIAYLACMESEEIAFQYSGSMLGWIYCTNVLCKVDYEKWEHIRLQVCEEVNVDLKANSEFWNQYDGAVAEMADKVNDTYLKANGQEEGVKSYDRMVDLLVNYYKDEVE